MVRRSMSKFFKRSFLKFRPEITPGVCPHCEMPSSFISIVNDHYRCMTCGEDLEQHIKRKISYLPVIVPPDGTKPFVRDWQE